MRTGTESGGGEGGGGGGRGVEGGGGEGSGSGGGRGGKCESEGGGGRCSGTMVAETELAKSAVAAVADSTAKWVAVGSSGATKAAEKSEVVAGVVAAMASALRLAAARLTAAI